jgi:GPH family glycoside/pentoside/hexuronide:cation symporter
MTEMSSSQTTSVTSRMRYAIGMFGTSIPINMFKTFAPIYYVDQLGISTRQFSTVVTVTAITDLIFVYIFGSLSDKKVSRSGRRKWMLYGSPLLSLAFIFFFNNQFILETRFLFFYLFLLYIVVAMFDGMINLNYGALFPELFADENDRIVANIYRQIFQIIAMIISVAATPFFVSYLGYGRVATIYGILSCCVIVFSALGYKEKRVVENEQKRKKFDVSQLISLLKEPLLWLCGGATLFYSVVFSLFTQGLPFYTRYALQEETSVNSVILFLVFAVTILSMLGFKKYLEWENTLHIWSGSYLLLSLGFLICFFSQTVLFTLIGSLLVGVGMGAMMTSSDIIGARVIDLDRKKNKHIRTGLFMSFFNSMFKLNGVVVGLAYLLTEVIFGFVSGEQVGHAPDQAAMLLFIYFPFIMACLGLILSLIFIKTFKSEVRKEEVAHE